MNAVAPLHMLLSASLFPEYTVLKTHRLPKLQADEMADAIHLWCATYTHLSYEWAVESGQVDLKTAINLSGPVEVSLMGFFEALFEITGIFELEYSEPIQRMPTGTRLMKPWQGQRCRLVERSDWRVLHFSRDEFIASIEKAAVTPVEEWDNRSTWGRPILKNQPHISEAWIRISERQFKLLRKTSLVCLLDSIVNLATTRNRRLKEILVAQQPRLNGRELRSLEAISTRTGSTSLQRFRRF